MILFDIAPVSTGTGTAVIAGLGFFLLFAGLAFFAFRMLKRTVKMAVRMAIVGVILLVAVVGAAYFFLSGPSTPPRPSRPAQTR